jgi:hypothetical protein
VAAAVDVEAAAAAEEVAAVAAAEADAGDNKRTVNERN